MCCETCVGGGCEKRRGSGAESQTSAQSGARRPGFAYPSSNLKRYVLPLGHSGGAERKCFMFFPRGQNTLLIFFLAKALV